jgi:CRISPR-associated protein Csm2
MTETSRAIVDRITKFTNFSEYGIRDLVQDAEKLGEDLKQNRLETNQVRKFLDAVKRIKANLVDEVSEEQNLPKPKPVEQVKKNQKLSEANLIDIVLLKPKLAYAAARQRSAEPLQSVLNVSIDRVHTETDFERLVQFVESIIAYHKAAGGK